MDAPFLVFSAKGKTPLQPSSVTNTESTPSHQTLSLDNLYLLCSTVSCSSFSPHRREDKQEGTSKPRLIQQKECNKDPSFPALYPHSLRSAESREVLRRLRPPSPSLVHKDHHSNGAAIGFSPQESLWEPSTGCTQYSPRTRLSHNRAMQLLSK